MRIFLLYTTTCACARPMNRVARAPREIAWSIRSMASLPRGNRSRLRENAPVFPFSAFSSANMRANAWRLMPAIARHRARIQSWFEDFEAAPSCSRAEIEGAHAYRAVESQESSPLVLLLQSHENKRDTRVPTRENDTNSSARHARISARWLRGCSSRRVFTTVAARKINAREGNSLADIFNAANADAANVRFAKCVNA